jgi:hypothetical protein
MMKRVLAVLVLAIFTFALPYRSHAAGPVIGIPGYYDPTTSTFVPLVAPRLFPLRLPSSLGRAP